MLSKVACFCMVAMAMVSVTFATDPELNAKITKDELYPSLNVIQTKCERPGRPEARLFTSSDDGYEIPFSEIQRLDAANAQKTAFLLHQQLTGIKGNYITNAETFFTETARALVAPSGVSHGFLSVGTDCSGMEL